MRALKRVLFRSSLLGVSILLALALAESGLRVFGYPNPLDYDPLYRSSPVPGLIYEMKPNFRGKERYGIPVATNSIGLRAEKEFAPTPPPGVGRIALLGDSVTFGHGIAGDRIYATLLEEKIASAGRFGRWEVMNFGVSGYSAAKLLTVFKEKALPYSPRVAVLALIENDFAPNRDAMTVTGEGYLSTPGAFLSGHMGLQTVLRKLCLTSVVKSVITRISGPQDDHASGGESGATLDPRYRSMIQRTVETFADLCRSAGVRGILAWVSVTRPGVMHDLARESAAAAGLEFASAHEEFAGRACREFTLPFDQHPNRLGHQLICEVLFRHLAGGSFLTPP
jgi:GDSL-like lipase/acylhydrolase family protein